MSKAICIVDGKEVKKGHPVRDDIVLRGIRRAKKWLGMYKGNKLVVCDEHLEEYLEKRRKFEKNAMVLGGVVAILIFLYFLALLANFTLQALASFLVFSTMLIVVFGLLIILSYVPAVEVEGERKGKGGKNREKKGKKVKKK